MNKYFEKVRDRVEDSMIPYLASSFAKSFIIGYYETAKVSGAIAALILLSNKKFGLACVMALGVGFCDIFKRDITEDWEI